MKLNHSPKHKLLHLTYICFVGAIIPSCMGGVILEGSNDYLYDGTISQSSGLKGFLNLYGGDSLSKQKLIYPIGFFQNSTYEEVTVGVTSIAHGRGVWTPRKDIRTWGQRAYFLYYGAGLRDLSGSDQFGYYLHTGLQFQAHRQLWVGLELMHREGMGEVNNLDSYGNPQSFFNDGLRLGISFSFRLSNEWLGQWPTF